MGKRAHSARGIRARNPSHTQGSELELQDLRRFRPTAQQTWRRDWPERRSRDCDVTCSNEYSQKKLIHYGDMEDTPLVCNKAVCKIICIHYVAVFRGTVLVFRRTFFRTDFFVHSFYRLGISSYRQLFVPIFFFVRTFLRLHCPCIFSSIHFCVCHVFRRFIFRRCSFSPAHITTTCFFVSVFFRPEFFDHPFFRVAFFRLSTFSSKYFNREPHLFLSFNTYLLHVLDSVAARGALGWSGLHTFLKINTHSSSFYAFWTLNATEALEIQISKIFR